MRSWVGSGDAEDGIPAPCRFWKLLSRTPTPVFATCLSNMLWFGRIKTLRFTTRQRIFFVDTGG